MLHTRTHTVWCTTEERESTKDEKTQRETIREFDTDTDCAAQSLIKDKKEEKKELEIKSGELRNISRPGIFNTLHQRK